MGFRNISCYTRRDLSIFIHTKIILTCALSIALFIVSSGTVEAEDKTSDYVFLYLPDPVMKYRLSDQAAHLDYVAKIDRLLHSELENIQSEQRWSQEFGQ